MNRRHCLGGLAALATRRCLAQQAPAVPVAGSLTLFDIVVGEFSTSLRLPPDFAFIAGMPVYLAFRVDGLRRETELNLISFDYTVEAVDAVGQPFEKAQTGRVTRRVAEAEPVAAPLVRTSVKVPEYIYPGSARFRIRVTDRHSRESATAEAEIPIRSDLPKPSGSFEVLRLNLYRGEFDESPLSNPVYRPGNPIWARFVLAGFQWKDGQYDLKYDVSVVARDGRVVLHVPDAAAERSYSTYQRSYVPALASVQLERAARPGDYTLDVVATDSLTKAVAKASARFRIAAE